MRNAVAVPSSAGVYLVAFYKDGAHTPYGAGVHGTALHYCGYADNIRARVSRHKRGIGARLCRAVVYAGFTLRVVAVWPGRDRNYERTLKRGHDLGRYCPVCRAEREMLSRVRQALAARAQRGA